MSLETTIYSLLGSTFDNELYPVTHPDSDGLESDVAELYATFLTVGGDNSNTLKNSGDLTRIRLQISIYGIDFLIVSNKKDAVKTVMKNANIAANTAIKNKLDPLSVAGSLPNIVIGDAIDGYEKDTKRFVKHLEFYCWVRDV